MAVISSRPGCWNPAAANIASAWAQRIVFGSTLPVKAHLRRRIRMMVAAAARCGNRVFGDQPSRRKCNIILKCSISLRWL